MKPRTKRQKQVIELKKGLITHYESLKKWGFDNCLIHYGFATKTRVLCMDCGERFSPDLVHRKRAVCPHCNRKLKVVDSKKRTHNQFEYFAIFEVVEQYQVVRYFRIESSHKDGDECYVGLYEIMQHWWLDYGKRELVSLLRGGGYYNDSWNGELEIRHTGNWKECLTPYKIHPSSQFRDDFKLRGFNHKNLQGLCPLSLMKVIQEPMAETLLKAKQHSLLQYYANGYPTYIKRHWASIKICMRNKYKVKDAASYIDYLDTLKFFGKDLRNAHYVCPKNFKREHDRYVEKKNIHESKVAEELKRKKAIESEDQYREFIDKFKDIVIEKENLVIEPLRTVQEFIEESDDLRHCVFANEYYRRYSSLILSAKKDGKRIETVEFSLKEGKVIQSRGKFNQNTDHHDSIVRIVDANRDIILQRHG